MKTDKARLPVRGETLLERVVRQVGPYFDQVLVSVSPGQAVSVRKAVGGKRGSARTRKTGRPARQRKAQEARGPGLEIVEDEVPQLGPLGGILAGLKASANDVCAVVACDIPDVNVPLLRKLVRALSDSEIAVPVTPAGQYEPLFAVYTKAVIPRIERLLRSGERSLIPLFRRCRTVSLRLDDAGRLRNLNTRQDYEAYLRSLGSE
jgi:molybdopterin-guanine dinucleotide biosynthesis protein A